MSPYPNLNTYIYTKTGYIGETNSHVSQRKLRIREKQPREHGAITLYSSVFSNVFLYIFVFSVIHVFFVILSWFSIILTFGA
jgi:hypothetical protein